MTTPSFRFNALQEELIELPPDDPEPQDEKQASSTPSDTGARDGSPFRRFGKRSTSVDTASTGDGMVADRSKVRVGTFETKVSLLINYWIN